MTWKPISTEPDGAKVENKIDDEKGLPRADRAENDLETIIDADTSGIANKILSSLTPKELNVLRLRFGLDDSEYDKATQDRIKEIELKALRKLRIMGNTHGQK